MNLPNIFLQIGKSLLAQVIQARYIKKKLIQLTKTKKMSRLNSDFLFKQTPPADFTRNFFHRWFKNKTKQKSLIKFLKLEYLQSNCS